MPEMTTAATVERVTRFRPGDLNDLCDAADLAIRDGGGFGWIDPPPRDVMERYWKGVLIVPERHLFVAKLDGVVAGSAQLVAPPRNNEAQAHSAQLTTSFVAPWARGHGLARKLIQAVETAARVAQETQVASAHQPGKHIGPVVSKQQWDKIQDLIQKGIDEGARLVAGGTGLPEGVNRGYFVRPTVFADVGNDMTIAQQEIFGPVLSIIPFDSEEEAIRIANDTPYGLTNYVQSQDGAKRNRVARRLRSGMVEMNGQSRGAGSAFGGVKMSGRAREGGIMGLEEFMDSKAISGWHGD